MAATYTVEVQLPVSTDIEEAAGGVVGTSHERVAIREELDGVDVGLVAGKGLDGLASTDIPQLGESIAGTGDEGVLIGGVQADAHDIAEMVGKLHNLGTRLDIPLHTGHVTRRSQDAAVVDEATAGEVAGVARELAGDTGGAVPVLVEVVDGADVVETTTGDVVTARSVCASHDPRGPQGDGMNLVCCVRVPNDQLSILRGRHQMSSVRRPVHGVDLGQVTLERSLRLHQLVSGDRIVGLLRHGAHCRNVGVSIQVVSEPSRRNGAIIAISDFGAD